MRVQIICSFLVVLSLVFAAQFEHAAAFGRDCERAEEFGIDCNISDLVGTCSDALKNGAPPTPECCTVAKKQQVCICVYRRCPFLYRSYKDFIVRYITGPDAYQTGKACGFVWPHFCML